jgi:GntR family transcriptional regulator
LENVVNPSQLRRGTRTGAKKRRASTSGDPRRKSIGTESLSLRRGKSAVSGKPTTPRYLKLAHRLLGAIRDGSYPVGSLLPTEVELSSQYRVSRQTVRQAIGELRQQNILSARKGVGTRVEARTQARRFSYSVMSANDLVDIATESQLIVGRSEKIVARAGLAADLGCRSGHRWLHLGCRRYVDGEPRPLSWVDVYIDGRLAPSLKLPKVFRTALFLIIERQSGEVLTQIRQEIRATILDEAVSERLDAEEGAPALEITRRYFSTGRRLVLVAINTFPADRFHYSVDITRD